MNQKELLSELELDIHNFTYNKHLYYNDVVNVLCNLITQMTLYTIDRNPHDANKIMNWLQARFQTVMEHDIVDKELWK